MAEQIEGSDYVSINEHGEASIEPDGYINEENVENFTFTFADGKDITESIEKKNVKQKVPVSFTKKGRTAYTPITVTYPDGVSTSSKFVLENCIVQYTEALKSPNHQYAKSFVIIGISAIVLDKIMLDARNQSNITLQVKENTALLNGYYWLRCNLDKLQGNSQIVLEGGQRLKMSVEQILKEMKKSLVAQIVFTCSGSMKNEKMDEELDLVNGTYNITMKPTELYASDVSDVEGPTLEDTNSRRKEGITMGSTLVATKDSELAAFAARRLRISK